MKKKYIFHLFAVFFLITSFSGGVNADLESSFDADADGWTTTPGIGGAINFSWESTGGNPGGFIAATDGGAQQWYFISPDSWDGDWSPYIGGMLRYDIRILNPTAPPYDYFKLDDVQIYSGTGNYAAWNSSINPTDSWTSCAVQLVSSNFTVTGSASFDDILANVTELRVRGEYLNYYDREGLDNVSITDVHAPAEIALFCSGLAGLIGISKRRKAG